MEKQVIILTILTYICLLWGGIMNYFVTMILIVIGLILICWGAGLWKCIIKTA
jgi:hypothetical protein